MAWQQERPMSFDLPTITTADLIAQEGKTVPQFCNCGYVDMHQNHCAHFVSHVLDIEVGLLCGSMAWATRGRGVSLRVNQVFNSLTTRGRWDDASQLPAAVANCNAFLLFATIPDNVSEARGVLTMGSHHLKHVGIYRGGTVWNFSNNHAHPQVISETAAGFRQRLTHVYGAGTRFFYGYQADL
jgi:hypothetical protein